MVGWKFSEIKGRKSPTYDVEKEFLRKDARAA